MEEGDHLSLSYLEGIAKVRFGISVVAEVLHQRLTEETLVTHGAAANILVNIAHRLIADRTVNHIDSTGKTDTSGPCIFLLKLLFRQYGSECMWRTAETCDWILPPELHQSEDVRIVNIEQEVRH